MRIIIHCGTHKTGSTTIQTVLRENTKELDKYNYRCITNNPRLNARNLARFDEEWIVKKIADAEASGVESFIFSAEMFSTLTSDELKKLTSLLQGHEITFVILFRHWVNFLPSKWAQYCLRCDTQSFPAFLNELRLCESKHLDTRFDMIMKRLISTNPKEIKAISYDNAVSSDGLLMTCFSAFGMPESLAKKLADSQTQLNIRQPLINTEVIRLFNGLYAEKYGFEQNAKFNRFLRNKPEIKFDIKKILSSIQAADFIDDLHHEIIASEVTVSLLREDSDFLLWEQRFLNVANEYSFNSIKGMFFENIASLDFNCSQIEINELNASLKQKLMQLI